MLKGIDETLHALLGCVSTALSDAGAPACSVGATIGLPAIANCCECDNGEGELWGDLLRVYRVGRGAGGYQDAAPQRPCLPSEWGAEFRITLSRCFPTVDEGGELPDVEDRSLAAFGAHADVSSIQRAIHCCVETEPPYLVSVEVQADPSGGCSYLVATVRVPVSMRASDNSRP